MERRFGAFHPWGSSLAALRVQGRISGLAAGGGRWTVVPRVAFSLLSNKTGSMKGPQPSNSAHITMRHNAMRMIRTRSRFLTAGKTSKSLPSGIKGPVFLAMQRSRSLPLRSCWMESSKQWQHPGTPSSTPMPHLCPATAAPSQHSGHARSKLLVPGALWPGFCLFCSLPMVMPT